MTLTTVEEPLALHIRTDVTHIPSEARRLLEVLTEPLIMSLME